METRKQCKNCEFNFNGECCGGGDLYKYGEKIIDDSEKCDCWQANIEYFDYERKNAPRFLREAYQDCSISYNDLTVLFEDYKLGKGIPINIFDAVKEIYGISMVDIAVILGVSFGVVYRAKTKGFAKKRFKQFSDELFINAELLQNATTNDFQELKKSASKFWAQSQNSQNIETMPNWKIELVNTISQMLNCPIHLAKDFSRVDKLYWSSDMSFNDFTESEKKLINYILNHNKYKKKVYSIEYALDISSKPHIHILMDNTKDI